jgi:uncharacterized lipoprotein YddW (UPF0748 family)
MAVKSKAYLVWFFIAFSLLLAGHAFSAVKEFRGVWVRPVSDEKEIIQTLDNIQKAHFNTIFLETFYNGFTIYPGKVFEQRKEFQGKDLLNIYITEAHKRNIEVHAWVHTLFWRYDTLGASVLTSHPEWLDKNAEGKGTRDFEKNYDFVNPALPQVHQMLQSLVSEIVKNYPVDGIHFDYLRYAANGDDKGFGYQPEVMGKFKKKYKIDPKVIDPVKTPAAYELWSRYREDQLTGLVKDLSATARHDAKKIKVSAAVFPDYYEQRFKNSKMQDYGTWCINGYLDFLTPMCYSYDTNGIIREIKVAQSHAGKVPIYPGLAARQGTPHPDFPTQIELVRRENPAGHSLFAYNWLITYPGIFDVLAAGLYKETAINW